MKIKHNLLVAMNSILKYAGIRVISSANLNNLKSNAAPSPLELANRYDVTIESILHIGGHFAEEAGEYQKQGVQRAAFIEGDPEIFELMKKSLNDFPQYQAVLALLSNEERSTTFYKASNFGASSSILEPERHTKERPDITFEKPRILNAIPLDQLKLERFDLVVIDVQGAEKIVIEGGINTISSAKALWVEVNSGSMYKGDSSVGEIIDLLADNFIPMYINLNENKWGDGFFLNKKEI